MAASKRTTFRLFYSWQSDLPDVVNAQLIRNALREVEVAFSEDHAAEIRLQCDEATRDVPGSPPIVDAIFEKIRSADVLVCDISKVFEGKSQEDGQTRKFCNPNIAIELGYAIRELGWSRIILVFNEAYGSLPGDLPFDTHGNRAMGYRCLADYVGRVPSEKCLREISNAKGQLRAQLLDALKLIAEKNPKRPRDCEAKPVEQTKRERDVRELNTIFHWIHLGVLEQFIAQLERGHVTDIGEDFFDGLSSVARRLGFHLHDVELRQRLDALLVAWERCFCYLAYMDRHRNGKQSYFRMPADLATSKEQLNQFHYTRDQAAPLRLALGSFLQYVRDSYLEIDPKTTGQEAFAALTAEDQD